MTREEQFSRTQRTRAEKHNEMRNSVTLRPPWEDTLCSRLVIGGRLRVLASAFGVRRLLRTRGAACPRARDALRIIIREGSAGCQTWASPCALAVLWLPSAPYNSEKHQKQKMGPGQTKRLPWI
jgi:hypothetical protein